MGAPRVVQSYFRVSDRDLIHDYNIMRRGVFTFLARGRSLGYSRICSLSSTSICIPRGDHDAHQDKQSLSSSSSVLKKMYLHWMTSMPLWCFMVWWASSRALDPTHVVHHIAYGIWVSACRFALPQRKAVDYRSVTSSFNGVK
eukprot:13723932-Heterocapsa_arctica.AAC.1